jgi:hypothetical protein
MWAPGAEEANGATVYRLTEAAHLGGGLSTRPRRFESFPLRLYIPG